MTPLDVRNAGDERSASHPLQTFGVRSIIPNTVETMSLQNIMETYRAFINCSLPALDLIFRNDANNVIDDWLQSNWEIIVEYYLTKTTSELVVLEVYGAGADCNGASSRVWEPSWRATHAVMCRLKSTGDKFKFTNFVGFDENGRYGNVVPYTHVECGDYVFVPVDDCVFELERLPH